MGPSLTSADTAESVDRVHTASCGSHQSIEKGQGLLQFGYWYLLDFLCKWSRILKFQ